MFLTVSDILAMAAGTLRAAPSLLSHVTVRSAISIISEFSDAIATYVFVRGYQIWRSFFGGGRARGSSQTDVSAVNG